MYIYIYVYTFRYVFWRSWALAHAVVQTLLVLACRQRHMCFLSTPSVELPVKTVYNML